MVKCQFCKLNYLLGSITSGGSVFSVGLVLRGNAALQKHRSLTPWRPCDLLLTLSLCGSRWLLSRVRGACLLMHALTCMITCGQPFRGRAMIHDNAQWQLFVHPGCTCFDKKHLRVIQTHEIHIYR